MRDEGKKIIGLDLTKYLKNYASIGEKYVVILEDIIEKANSNGQSEITAKFNDIG